MKNRLVIAVAIVLIISGLLVVSGKMMKSERSNAISNMAIPLPDSLDNWFETKTPWGQPLYLFRMYELGGPMMGVLVNTQQDDMTNAKISYQIFKNEYRNSSKMVPEWRRYYDLEAVDKVGNALEAGDKNQILASMDVVFQTCAKCHVATKTKVFAKYNWKDLKDVKMKTVNPEQPEAPWTEAKAKYLVTGFDGTIVNARENQQEAANKSFQQFKTMFLYMKDACSSCHDTERRYYVSDDVMALVSKAEGEISSGDLTSASNTMQQIGGACFDCHQTHEPLQRLKELVSTDK
ncbi:Cytochrome C' [uncultured archaeon]|nr:Cytochrome C' [uncultured archaeon]